MIKTAIYYAHVDGIVKKEAISGNESPNKYTYGEQVMCKIQPGVRASDKEKDELGYCLTAQWYMMTSLQTWASQVSLNSKRVFSTFSGLSSFPSSSLCLHFFPLPFPLC